MAALHAVKSTKRTLSMVRLAPLTGRMHRYIWLGYSDARIAELFGCAAADVGFIRDKGEW